MGPTGGHPIELLEDERIGDPVALPVVRPAVAAVVIQGFAPHES